MKSAIALLLIFATVIGCSAIFDIDSSKNRLDALDWLSGSWSGTAWGSRFDAFYSSPQGGKILGISESIKEGQATYHEFERFEIRDGTIILIPYPGGRPAEQFKLADLDTKQRKAIFENPHKDYPTRIAYQRVNERELLIILSDPHGESDKTERFEFIRATPARDVK